MSQDGVDVTIHPGTAFQITHNERGIAEAVARLQAVQPILMVLEATGVSAQESRHLELLSWSFYLRLCQAGKIKKLALTVCMRKLLTILNTMVKSGTP
ncbi:MAG: hypothetical protein H8K10_05960 [Nitrospira sp.]|nr:hypothetical protein [Nitrospira sp.]